MQPSIELDAAEFGIHVKQGEWRLGLLVARNVKPAKAGRPHENGSHEPNTEAKISLSEFARLSGQAHKTVRQYLKAWDKAAKAGHVPPSSELTPGEEVDLDVSQLPSWTTYYMSYERERIIKESREALAKPTVGNWEAGESITKKKYALVDSYPTAPELINSIEIQLMGLFGWRYVMNKADLKRIEAALHEALKEVENYDPEARKKAPHPVVGKV